jgi:CO/xanthine dehydrogenase FAD-binding subunit
MRPKLAYLKPSGLNEALQFLEDHGEETTLVAGGTDVMVDLRSGRLRTRYLMDISRLRDLKGIETEGGAVTVGAGVTISELCTSNTLKRLAPALQKAGLKFGSAQIRNMATIGGNVAHCSPCGDTVPPLIIHEAQAVLISQEGERKVPVESLAAGPYQSAIFPHEILSRFLLKPVRGSFSDFQKIGRRRELAISRISMAVMAEREGSGRINFIRLALGASTPTPRRMEEIENLLAGKVLEGDTIWEAGSSLASKMIEISGRRPSAVYKEKAVQGLLMRLLSPLTSYGKEV